MRKFMSVLLSAAMVLTAVPVSVSLSPKVEVSAEEETEYADATQYTYKITPILEPFEYYIYVETDNPDPYSFAFVDNDSVYTEEGDDAATYALIETVFVDVKYESDDSYRVNGGYIFYCKEGKSDGGELSLLQTTGIADEVTTYYWGTGQYATTIYYDYEDTGITITAPDMVDYIDYLIDAYTSDDQSFFEKLDAVQAGLDSIAVYPRTVYDSNQPTGFYPALACSWYKELSLNEHYDIICAEADGMLLSYVYPFVLDSLGFPGAISSVAQRLDSSAEVSSTDLHYMITVTYDGESASYGGAGSGGNDPLYSEHVGKLFTFEGSSSDFSSDKTVEEYCSQLLSYEEVAAEDAEYYRDLIAGDTYQNTISATGGTWIRVAYEGYAIGSCLFAYAVPTAVYDGVYIVSDAWVDGRYIGNYEYMEVATFDEHPTSNIVVTDMTYTDAYGDVHTQDVIFYYDSDSETWIAGYAFTGYWDDESMPDEFILTADDVASMNVDSKNGSVPESGLVYDGTEFPGTEFTNVLVNGIEADEKVEVTVGRSVSFDYAVTPENATYTSISYSSDDSDIAYVESDYDTGELSIYGAGVGTTNVTLLTQDGRYEATIEVTVVDHIYSGDFVFDKIDDNSVVLLEYTGTDEDVVIPSEVEGYQVTGIDDNAFNDEFIGNWTVRNITVPDGVTSIGEYAFCDCQALESIILPDGITYFGEGVFVGCFGLDNVSLPSGLKTISVEMFAICYGLTSVWIPSSVTTIEHNAFYNCYFLTDVYFEGTEEEWNAIVIDENNEYLTSATIHFNASSLEYDLGDINLGDINEDGFIDYLDAMTALRYDAELITLTDEQLAIGDVNNDGEVNSLDAILILRYDVGLIESF